MSFVKRVMSRLVASVVATGLLIALGGGGAVVTAVVTFAQGASPASLSLLGVSASVLFLGIFAAYRHAHPSPTNETLLQRQREMVISWRRAIGTRTVAPSERVPGGWTPITDAGWYRSLRPHLASGAREAFESDYSNKLSFGTHGDAGRKILLDEIARLERDWGLV